MATTSGRQFYEAQLAYLAARETDALVDNQYAAEGTLITFDTLVKGKAALKKYFRSYLETLGYIKLISTDKFAETSDAIFFESTVETKLGIAHVYDAFVLKDGKATHHFAGLK